MYVCVYIICGLRAAWMYIVFGKSYLQGGVYLLGLAKDRIQLSWWFDNKQYLRFIHRSLSGGQGAATTAHVTLALRQLCTYTLVFNV